MTSKVSNAIKLVPVLIGGAYSVSPALLPTPPKEMEELLKERECYIVTNVGSEKTQNLEYLLACYMKKYNQSLDFFFYSKKSESKGIAIPVKYLNELGGAEIRKKALT